MLATRLTAVASLLVEIQSLYRRLYRDWLNLYLCGFHWSTWINPHLTRRRRIPASAPASWWWWRCRWCRGSVCGAAGWPSTAQVSGGARGPTHPCCRWPSTRNADRSGPWSGEWLRSVSVFGRPAAPWRASRSRDPGRWWRRPRPEWSRSTQQNSSWVLCDKEMRDWHRTIVSNKSDSYNRHVQFSTLFWRSQILVLNIKCLLFSILQPQNLMFALAEDIFFWKLQHIQCDAWKPNIKAFHNSEAVLYNVKAQCFVLHTTNSIQPSIMDALKSYS